MESPSSPPPPSSSSPASRTKTRSGSRLTSSTRWKTGRARQAGWRNLVTFVFLVSALYSLTVRTLHHLDNSLDFVSRDIYKNRVRFPSKETGVMRRVDSTFPSSSASSCWKPEPVYIANVSRVLKDGYSNLLVQPSPPSSCGRLRRNWSTVEVRSPIAKNIERHQSDCTLPVATDYVDDNYGMGSHLYVWTQAVCNSMEMGFRLRSINPQWLWLDKTYCDEAEAERSPLNCYFPMAEDRCGDAVGGAAAAPDAATSLLVNVTDPRDMEKRCSSVKQDLHAFRAAAVEYLFQSVSPLVLREAERQIGLLFNDYGQAPSDLIAVHIRWGDKFWEMDLPSENEYVDAVCQLVSTNARGEALGAEGSATNDDNCDSTVANIYLASEDPRAVDAFKAAAPKGWNIYVDRTVAELSPYRPLKGNRASWTARNTLGRAGLVALGSLLVALEANDFVLTTQSNWSRLINELRKNVLDFRCDNCTRVIDLRPGQW